MLRVIKILLGAGSIVVAAFSALPWILYAFGLGNIIGRPSLPVKGQLTIAEAQLLWTELKEKGPLKVEKLNPWRVVYRLYRMDNQPSSGERLAWLVAREHNSHNLKNRKMAFWHLSGAALTIWLTRNWSTEQLLAKAYEILSASKNSIRQ